MDQRDVTIGEWLLCAGMLAICALFAFLPALENGFVNWDDPGFITENPHIRSTSPDAIFALFGRFIQGNYIPLTFSLFALQFRLFGLEPFWFHLVSLALHFCSGLLVFGLLARLVRRPLPALLGAGFWLVHPLRVESVAWATEQKDVLYVLFYLASLAAFLRHLATGRSFWYLSSLGIFLCSLFSKGLAVTLPILLGVFLWFEGRRSLRDGALLIPFLGLSLLFGVVTLVGQMEKSIPDQLVWWSSFVAACHGLGFYLGKTLFPVGLSALYPYPEGWPHQIPAGMIASVPVVFLLGVWVLKPPRNRVVLVGAASFLIPLAPVLQFLPSGLAFAADRYSYLPAFGVSVILAWILAREDLEDRPTRRVFRNVAVLLVCLWIVGLACISRDRCGVWASSLTLWNDAVGSRPHPLTYEARGVAYLQEGAVELAERDLRAALAKAPGLPRALNALGVIELGRGNYREAEQRFRTLVRQNPRNADAWCNLANALMGRGVPTEALEACNRALELRPTSVEALNNRGVARRETGDLSGSLADLDRALAIAPEDREIRQNRARTILELERQGGRTK